MSVFLVKSSEGESESEGGSLMRQVASCLE